LAARSDIPAGDYSASEEMARAVLDGTIATALDGLEVEGARERIVPRLEFGDPRAALIDAARSADLLILGARGRGGLAHLLVGSVTTALLHRPVVATVVVPQTERQD
jgi:nucleotide-binding universal stress UspA family protein